MPSSDSTPTPDRSTSLGGISLGVWIIAALAIGSSLMLAFAPARVEPGRTMWTFSRLHQQLYEPKVSEWNNTTTTRVNMTLLSIPALEQRMLSGFLARTATADVIEAERRIAARAFTGPLESVGFVDLTDRLREEGLDVAINTPSFSPWTSRGRIFGLPHDIHPVMLAYRADIVEAAGIDMSEVKTWSDFEVALRPLMADRDNDGAPDRYLLNFWETHFEQLEVYILQAGGRFFDEQGRPDIDTDVNAKVLSTLVSWCNGPTRICADAPEFSASGNRLLMDGYVLAAIVPDWMCNVWRNEMPQLAGKMKLMPIPAWEPGGRRTSVRGGTMLGISRDAGDFEDLWRFAKHLYLSRDVARELYRTGDIVTPVKTLWDDPIFDEPDAFFGGQPKGRMFLDLAPSVPVRTSSPYNRLAQLRTQDALVSLGRFSRTRGVYQPDELHAEARRLLRNAQDAVARELDRNVFLRPESEGVAR